MDQHAQPQLPPDSPLMNMSNSFLNDGMLLLSMPGFTRDPTYYIHDGNSVVLVEKTLFKVSPSPLQCTKHAGVTGDRCLAFYVGTSLRAHEGQVCVRDHVSTFRGDRLRAFRLEYDGCPGGRER